MDSDFQMPLILDGAMGTALMMRGIKAPLPLWSAAANYENFNEVVSIHKEYIKSGSNVITTNSFRSTPRTFRKAGYSKSDAIIKSEQSLILAIEAANIARKGRSVLVAGSLAPLEDCYEPSDFPGKNIAKDGCIDHKINDIDIAEQLMFAVNEGTSVLGACCGSTPDTINIITENLKNSRNR